ncbi:PREDICTED: zinc finger protein 283-like [Dufourea novaeangliae]|uniref:zinc finger protein 283-like n=1 Tax=Dufourea novaeangliae TaxID=178035 RepID=UPI0007673740|nr:PREDICTED: zinc finger protein 283-like [Dufourea novaeangliae]
MNSLCPMEFVDTKNFMPSPVIFRPRVPRIRSQTLQNYMCGECGKGYKWMANLRRHQRLECGKLPKHRCRLCRKEFYRRYELTNHYNTKHTAANEYENTEQKDPSTGWTDRNHGEAIDWYLKSEYETSQTLFEFVASSYDSPEVEERKKTTKTVICEECGKSFSRLDSLRRHEKNYCKVKGERLFCRFCGKTFVKPLAFITHVKSMHSALLAISNPQSMMQ